MGLVRKFATLSFRPARPAFRAFKSPEKPLWPAAELGCLSCPKAVLGPGRDGAGHLPGPGQGAGTRPGGGLLLLELLDVPWG